MSQITTADAAWSFSPSAGYRRIRAGLRQRRLLRKARGWDREDQARLEFYRRFAGPGDLVLDIGANQGNRTKVFLKLGARVVAVEPQAECVAFLENAFPGEPNLAIESVAVGAEPGEAQMMLSRHSTIATLAEDWVDSVSASGRFDRSLWEGRVTVPVTTLDALIAKHGRPAFVKIDVEGFELEALRGLSQPCAAVSLEFVPEEFDKAVACVDRLEAFGDWRYQISLGESMRFTADEPVTRDALVERLRDVPADSFGDIYAFSGAPRR